MGFWCPSRKSLDFLYVRAYVWKLFMCFGYVAFAFFLLTITYSVQVRCYLHNMLCSHQYEFHMFQVFNFAHTTNNYFHSLHLFNNIARAFWLKHLLRYLPKDHWLPLVSFNSSQLFDFWFSGLKYGMIFRNMVWFLEIGHYRQQWVGE